MSEVKYYKLEELKVGMEVSVSSLDKIVGTRICLDSHTFRDDDSVIGYGKIVFIGNDDYKSAGLTVSDIVVVFNAFDAADPTVSFDEELSD